MPQNCHQDASHDVVYGVPGGYCLKQRRDDTRYPRRHPIALGPIDIYIYVCVCESATVRVRCVPTCAWRAHEVVFGGVQMKRVRCERYERRIWDDIPCTPNGTRGDDDHDDGRGDE
eukprot:3870806-Pyramimonas_sp.AAC.1